MTTVITIALSSTLMAQDDTDSAPIDGIEKPGLTAEEIDAIALPNYRQLLVDTNLLNDRWYMQVKDTITVHDAPNGNPIRILDGGFNFITALQEQDGWIEINPGEWVESSHLASSNQIISQFTGIFLPEDDLQIIPAWLLVNLYPSSEPGGDPLESNGLMYRYTLVHIYDQVEIDGWYWYQIGPDQWVFQMHVAKVLPIKRPATVETEKWVSVDLYEEVVIAYEGNRAVFATLAATGLPRWPTYEGTFHIYYRHVRENMSWGTPGDDFYFLEEVPWTMYFDDGRALHGAYWHDGFGYRRSHGCVNLSITDAHWLYDWVAEDFDNQMNSSDVEEGPAVYVYSSGIYQ
jgi:hypothetical protein